jgi:hypothetical protein
LTSEADLRFQIMRMDPSSIARSRVIHRMQFKAGTSREPSDMPVSLALAGQAKQPR